MSTAKSMNPFIRRTSKQWHFPTIRYCMVSVALAGPTSCVNANDSNELPDLPKSGEAKSSALSKDVSYCDSELNEVLSAWPTYAMLVAPYRTTKSRGRSKSGEIIWTVEAVRWLDEIHAYIASDNEVAAEWVVSGIFDKVQLLATQPHLGQRYELIPDREVREILYGHYRIACLSSCSIREANRNPRHFSRCHGNRTLPELSHWHTGASSVDQPMAE